MEIYRNLLVDVIGGNFPATTSPIRRRKPLLILMKSATMSRKRFNGITGSKGDDVFVWDVLEKCLPNLISVDLNFAHDAALLEQMQTPKHCSERLEKNVLEILKQDDLHLICSQLVDVIEGPAYKWAETGHQWVVDVCSEMLGNICNGGPPAFSCWRKLTNTGETGGDGTLSFKQLVSHAVKKFCKCVHLGESFEGRAAAATMYGLVLEKYEAFGGDMPVGDAKHASAWSFLLSNDCQQRLTHILLHCTRRATEGPASSSSAPMAAPAAPAAVRTPNTSRVKRLAANAEDFSS